MTRPDTTLMLLAGVAALLMISPVATRGEDCLYPLIRNGSAEDTAGTVGSPGEEIPSWSFSGGMRTMPYGAPGSLTGLPDNSGNWGLRYFDGGDSDLAVATQVVPVRPECESYYDAAFYGVHASIHLGTVAGEPDAGWVEVRYLDAVGRPLGGFQIGGPPNGTPGSGETSSFTVGSAPIPPGTRGTEFRVYLQNFNGGRNTAWVDLLVAALVWPDPVQPTTWGGLKALYR